MQTSENVELAWTRFYVQYGRAMLGWAMIESELATLFSVLTRISPDIAVQIFYSPRGFKGRTDIFKASLNACKISEELRTLTRALLNKADQYSDCRNRFAHDQPLLRQTALPAAWDILLVDGKRQFQDDETKRKDMVQAMPTQDIADVADQFLKLAHVIRDCWLGLRSDRPPALQKLHVRLAALPSLPRAKVQRQQPAKPRPQRRPSRQ